MKYSRFTARHRPPDELFLSVLPAHDPDWPDVWGRGKLSQLLAWEIRRHRSAVPPRGPYRLRFVEVIDFPRRDRTYEVIPRDDLEVIEATLPALLRHMHALELLALKTGGYIYGPLS